MIINSEQKSAVRSALQLIEDSPHAFYLGGSRRIAEKHGLRIVDMNTDYDFYADYSDSLAKWLSENGFVMSKGYGYRHKGGLDSEAIAIFQKDNVDVILRKDATFYKKVFESIDPDFYCKFLWKKQAERSDIQPIMNALFAAARSTYK